MITLTPIELESIINAAILEIAGHPDCYKIARPKAREIYRWVTGTIWDNPKEPAIMIDELPF